MIKCQAIKDDGDQCGCFAMHGSNYCRHHLDYIPEEIPDKSQEDDFFKNYSVSDIYTYVFNKTNGLKKLNTNLPLARMKAVARRYVNVS